MAEFRPILVLFSAGLLFSDRHNLRRSTQTDNTNRRQSIKPFGINSKYKFHHKSASIRPNKYYKKSANSDILFISKYLIIKVNTMINDKKKIIPKSTEIIPNIYII